MLTPESEAKGRKAAEELRTLGVQPYAIHHHPDRIEVSLYGGVKAARLLQAAGIEVSWTEEQDGYGRTWRHFSAQCFGVTVQGCDYAENVKTDDITTGGRR